MNKPLIVQKFGGTSVGSIENIHIVAEHVIKAKEQGNQVVVVVSAMSGETNRLLGLAHDIDAVPNARELDVLLAAGEQVSMSLLAMTLNKLGHKACSMTGGQAQIVTNDQYGDATIESIDTRSIKAQLDEDMIVIIAGFQGVDTKGNITTLGRGGSDTSAVTLAGALHANECQIFTDVDGIYTCDPRVVSNAKKLETIDFHAMEEMARMGAKVLHLPSVQYAKAHNVPLRVLSTFVSNTGSLVQHAKSHNQVSGLAIQQNMMLIQVDSDLCATLIKQCDMLGIKLWNFIEGEKFSEFIIKHEYFAKLSLICDEKINNSKIVSLLTIVSEKEQGDVAHSCELLAQQDIGISHYFVRQQSFVLVVCPTKIEHAANILHEAYITPCNIALS
ncbi:aspartate kinase [Vibrio sp. 10N.286.49.B3]|uniref:aspartate kinase n=1 Tax=Vibrio sp. 10N.286.49.B3 TaxID=1880855 RepID=UPI000C838025|nr:aspartate kinase [Vibrio sp. 10N.286.49.B3]PMH43825.1 aspartate kinase [Vibrio sp. 10N.286.49.B3]